jgi:hypothetical protein
LIADRGPSGEQTQDSCAQLGIQPIIPLRSNVKNEVFITEKKEKRFYTKYIGNAEGSWLERMYNIRVRIEEYYNLTDTVYHLQRLHGCGQNLMNIEILLVNILGVLIPLTAFKIGRPDLMWRPSQFREQPLHPERLFPAQFRQLNNFRWDDEICISPSRYREWITKQMSQNRLH